MAAQVNMVAITDQLTLRVSEVLNVLRMMKKEGVELMDPLIITQSLSQGALPVESSSADFVVGICRSCEFLNDQLFIDILRVLKPDGSVLVWLTSQSTTQKVEKSSIERKLLLAGFLDVEASEAGHVIGVSGKKSSWKIGSSFSIKKEKKSLPPVIIDEDMDLIDEDSLLTEEDLKKPQLPVGDCEVGKTRKACKNCTCGRAEAEQKVEKIGLTMDLLEKPQSACGNCMTQTRRNQTEPLAPYCPEIESLCRRQSRQRRVERQRRSSSPIRSRSSSPLLLRTLSIGDTPIEGRVVADEEQRERVDEQTEEENTPPPPVLLDDQNLRNENEPVNEGNLVRNRAREAIPLQIPNHLPNMNHYPSHEIPQVNNHQVYGQYPCYYPPPPQPYYPQPYYPPPPYYLPYPNNPPPPQQAHQVHNLPNPLPQNIPPPPNQVPLNEFANHHFQEGHHAIRPPPIEANDFDLTNLFALIQHYAEFFGLETEDPHAHLSDFLAVCGTIKQNGVSQEAIRLIMFPFSLRNEAREWLSTLPHHSLTTWEEVTDAFLLQYFPPWKTLELRERIFTFRQEKGESIEMAWERFKKLLKRCPNHEMTLKTQIQLLYKGLSRESRVVLDIASSGSFMCLEPQDGHTLIERVANNSRMWVSKDITRDAQPKKVAGVLELDSSSAIMAHLAQLDKKFDKLALGNAPQLPCTKCGGGHATVNYVEPGPVYPMMPMPEQYIEDVNYMGQGRMQNNAYSNFCNPVYRNHQNFSWKDPNQGTSQGGQAQSHQQNTYRQPQAQPTYQNQGLQHAPPGFPAQGSQNVQVPVTSKKADWEIGLERRAMFEKMASTMESHRNYQDGRMKNLEASLKNVEHQIGQLAERTTVRPPGRFPSNTEKNQKDVHAIYTRSGKIVGLQDNEDGENEDVTKEAEVDKETNEESEEEKLQDIGVGAPDNSPSPCLTALPYAADLAPNGHFYNSF